MDHFQAEDLIDADVSTGAISEYVDGDTALEILGDLFALHNTPKPAGVDLFEHLRNVNLAISKRLVHAQDQIVSDNVDFVMQAAAEDKRHARSDYRELVTERVTH